MTRVPKTLLAAFALCVSVVVASAAPPAAAQQSLTTVADAGTTDANIAALDTAWSSFLDRGITQAEIDRYERRLGHTLTERDVHVELLGTQEFYRLANARLRPFIHEVSERARGRRATRLEVLGLRDLYRAADGARRHKRRAVAAAILSSARYDADGFRVNRLNTHRDATGFVTSVNLRLNTPLQDDDFDVSVEVDRSPVDGTIELLDGGRHVRITPARPFLATGDVMAVVTSAGSRGDAAGHLTALRGTFFPHIRVVAYYGNHLAAAMGVLGETGPEQAVVRVRNAASRFDRPGRPAVGAFEMIATVAQASAGADGNYSHPSDIEDLRRWIDIAHDAGMYVILDIQPGRSDFFTETTRYRELLLEPHVGVALDPEWRMASGQRPGQVVGSVTAAEVNQVSEWLSDLVMENNLPDKMFILHQFQSRMIQNRDDVAVRPGLATIIHADGFGGRAIKLETYGIINVDRPLWNGFKLFIDEDTRIFQPSEVLSFTTVPVPDLITYQ